MEDGHEKPSIRLRVVFGGNAMLGPGKADLLELIGKTGSISAAGRAMGMSYKRAWMLVETLNGIFREPLVESSRGGASGGGARLTATGAEVLAQFRRLEAQTETAGKNEIEAIRRLLRDISGRK
jgi:molybdate transport system regulatory protein